jgi:hypothetical protein
MQRLKVVIPGQRGLVWLEDRGILGPWSLVNGIAKLHLNDLTCT